MPIEIFWSLVKQVVPSIAMVETYTRLLLIAPHSLFRSLISVSSSFVCIVAFNDMVVAGDFVHI